MAEGEPEPEPEPEEAEEPSGNSFYIRDGGTSSSCSSWSDACDALPSASPWSAAPPTTSPQGATRAAPTAPQPPGRRKITIRGATVANHGTSTGWSPSAYSVSSADGGSQAVWTSGLQFKTSNWDFDGGVGPDWSKTSTAYGFKIDLTSYAIRIYNTSSAISNGDDLRHHRHGSRRRLEKFFRSTDNGTKSVNEVTLSHTLLDGWSNTVWGYVSGPADGQLADRVQRDPQRL